MNRRLALFALALAALLAAGSARADMTRTVLVSAASTPGPSSVIYTTVAGVDGDRWSFQYHATADGAAARLEGSLDSVSWATIGLFLGTDAVLSVLDCGGCKLRVAVIRASSTARVSIFVVQSGSLTPAVAP